MEFLHATSHHSAQPVRIRGAGGLRVVVGHGTHGQEIWIWTCFLKKGLISKSLFVLSCAMCVCSHPLKQQKTNVFSSCSIAMQSLYKFTTTFMAAVCILFLANMSVYTLMEREDNLFFSSSPPMWPNNITRTTANGWQSHCDD